MAAEIADRVAEGRVVQFGDQPGDPCAAAGQPVPEFRRSAPQQPLVLGVRHLVDPGAQGVPARPGEQPFQPGSVFQREHLPAGAGEHALQPGRRDAGHHAVQRLPVHVHDPDDLPQLRDAGVEDRFPHGALVQLGITEQ